MNPILRNALAFIAALIFGGIVNSLIIKYGGNIIPPPEGVDPNNIDSIRENIGNYSPSHFAIPFLAHALGTLVGAGLVAKYAASNQMKLALGIGAFFLIGGIMMVMMIPETPIWFSLLDLVGAYIPMGWLGWKLAGSSSEE